jgi:hypothetical protein
MVLTTISRFFSREENTFAEGLRHEKLNEVVVYDSGVGCGVLGFGICIFGFLDASCQPISNIRWLRPGMTDLRVQVDTSIASLHHERNVTPSNERGISLAGSSSQTPGSFKTFKRLIDVVLASSSRMSNGQTILKRVQIALKPGI